MNIDTFITRQTERGDAHWRSFQRVMHQFVHAFTATLALADTNEPSGAEIRHTIVLYVLNEPIRALRDRRECGNVIHIGHRVYTDPSPPPTRSSNTTRGKETM